MSHSHTYRFGKAQKLKSRKQIDQLFAHGQAMAAAPLRLRWMSHHLEQPLQAGVSVSRKLFRRAVDRNRIKRLMREAYRLHKLPLETHLREKAKSISVFWMYSATSIKSFSEIQEACQSLIAKLIRQTS